MSAGMDMELGFVADHSGRAVAEEIERNIEYIWTDNPESGLFSIPLRGRLKAKQEKRNEENPF
ncbi:hypothetical protein [Neisseria animalis]|uniref:Uncharacterized protein n=1 Tax=Neisseria animalis TaxID=492 RepID=A0A5P3MPA7_NEIAN|nr:hypothetical protein [Neisseria animalis]QEY23363.1 hypothetical protein D0T90_01640 [Neisseria animalis]ROW33209.1 hypothetical protein CGZ60_00375 [Neisseria animalis]